MDEVNGANILSHGACTCEDENTTRLPEKCALCSMDVVASVRIVRSHANMNVVIGIRDVLCHPLVHKFGFPLRVQILILLSCCSNSSITFTCSYFAHVLHRRNTSFEVWYCTPSRKSCLEELFQILLYQIALFNQYLVHLHGNFQQNKESTKNLANSTMKKKNFLPIVGFVEPLLFLSIAKKLTTLV